MKERSIGISQTQRQKYNTQLRKVRHGRPCQKQHHPVCPADTLAPQAPLIDHSDRPLGLYCTRGESLHYHAPQELRIILK